MPALADRTVVITGAGRGIGAACALAAAREGANVVVNDIDPDPAIAVAEAIRASGGKAVACQANVSVWQEAERLIGTAVHEFGALHGLVNNAGIIRHGMLAELAEADVRATVEVNVLGTIFSSHHAVRHMAPAGAGAIVNMCSSTQMGRPAFGVYGATKGAIATMTYAWALELRSQGIRVNAVTPIAETQMSRASDAYFSGRTAAARVPSPDAATNAPLVCFLLSDLSAGITGQNVRIEDRKLNLMSHPAILGPARTGTWDIDALSALFRDELAEARVPLGYVVIDPQTPAAKPA